MNPKPKRKKVTLAAIRILEDEHIISLYEERILIKQLARRLIFTNLIDSRIWIQDYNQMVKVMDSYKDHYPSQNTITFYNRAGKKINNYLNDKDYYN